MKVHGAEETRFGERIFFSFSKQYARMGTTNRWCDEGWGGVIVYGCEVDDAELQCQSLTNLSIFINSKSTLCG